MKFTLNDLRKAYRAGYNEALYNYAVWCDGVQLVGCGTKTLETATKQGPDSCESWISNTYYECKPRGGG